MTRPLDVALVCQNVVRRDGQGRVMLELARQVASRGHRVTVYAHALAPELADGIRFRRVPRVFGPQLLDDLWFLAWASVAVRRRRHDVVCALGPTVLPRGPFVFDVQFSHRGWRATWTPATRPSLYHRLHARLVEALEWLCVRRADRVIASTPRLAEEVAPGARHTVVVPNGVSPEEFTDPDPAVRREVREHLGIPQDAFVVALLGGWTTARKGLDPLLEAVALGPPDEWLLLAAEGPRDALEARTGSLGVSDRVAVAGFEPPPRVFAAADVVVVPSLYEPFSLVALEAAAAGVPVVLSERAGAADVLGDTVVAVDPADPLALRKGLDRVRHEPGLAEDMVTEGRRRSEQLRWGTVLGAAVDVIEEVAR